MWLCAALQVFRASGPKWKLMYALYSLPGWGELTKDYGAIMVADDDLTMTTCILNKCVGPCSAVVYAVSLLIIVHTGGA